MAGVTTAIGDTLTITWTEKRKVALVCDGYQFNRGKQLAHGKVRYNCVNHYVKGDEH